MRTCVLSLLGLAIAVFVACQFPVTPALTPSVSPTIANEPGSASSISSLSPRADDSSTESAANFSTVSPSPTSSESLPDAEEVGDRFGELEQLGSVASVVARVKPSVVLISSVEAEGSGVIFHPDGYVLTNAHVIEGVTDVRVRTDTGTVYRAEIVAKSDSTDLAILKIKANGLSKVTFVSASHVALGDEVVALGFPLDSSAMTVTRGIVSAFRTVGGVEYVQTDAAINPGNSGGPLVDS